MDKYISKIYIPENTAESFSIDDLWRNEFDLDALRNTCIKLQTDSSAIDDLINISQQGSVAAKWYLGDAYYNGKFVEKDLSKAAKWYAELEAKKIPYALFMLGRVDLPLLWQV